MLKFKSITVGPFQENTYIVHNDSICWIIDPGCYFTFEFDEIKSYISHNNLKPTQLLLTHGHLDHIFGNHLIYKHFGLSPIMHSSDLPFVENLVTQAEKYSLFAKPSPLPKSFIEEGDDLYFEKQKIDIIWAPGHSPGSVCFYFENEQTLIGGDVLFKDSIGRTDLPMGDYDTLINSINNKIFTLPNDTIVLSGHGPQTTVGYEKKNNPFFK